MIVKIVVGFVCLTAMGSHVDALETEKRFFISKKDKTWLLDIGQDPIQVTDIHTYEGPEKTRRGFVVADFNPKLHINREKNTLFFQYQDYIQMKRTKRLKEDAVSLFAEPDLDHLFVDEKRNSVYFSNSSGLFSRIALAPDSRPVSVKDIYKLPKKQRQNSEEMVSNKILYFAVNPTHNRLYWTQITEVSTFEKIDGVMHQRIQERAFSIQSIDLNGKNPLEHYSVALSADREKSMQYEGFAYDSDRHQLLFSQSKWGAEETTIYYFDFESDSKDSLNKLRTISKANYRSSNFLIDAENRLLYTVKAYEGKYFIVFADLNNPESRTDFDGTFVRSKDMFSLPIKSRWTSASNFQLQFVP